MKRNLRPIVAGVAAGLVLNGALALDFSARQTGIEAIGKQEFWFCKHRLQGENFSRTELFFGLSKPDGSVVTEEDFQHFVDTEVTPRFPDGLTLLTGTGQFKDSSGTTLKEGSKLLILLYPFNSDSHQAIEQIREAYITAFRQQSVLRVDEPSCVSF